MKKETITAIREQGETVTRDLRVAAACLETISNSLFFAEERKDRDMTKPASLCVELVKKMIDDCIDGVEGITWEIDRNGKEA